MGWAFLILNAGRGADDAWAAGHLVLFVANAFWVPVVLVLPRDYAPDSVRRRDDVALGLVIFGSLCVAAQLTVDLVAWALGMDLAELRQLFGAVRGQLILTLLFYLVGPPLLFLGVLLSALRLRPLGGRPRTGATLVALGLLVVLAGALTTFSVVTLAGYIVVLAGFALIASASATIAA